MTQKRKAPVTIILLQLLSIIRQPTTPVFIKNALHLQK